MIFLAALVLVRFMGIASSPRARQAEIPWLVLTMAFEVLFGRFVMGDTWRRLFEAYEVWNGNLGTIVLLSALCSPYLAGKVRSVSDL